LTIRGELKNEEETKEKDYYYAERSYGSFSRRLNLPAKVQESEIRANIKDGIIEINITKAPEAKVKQIKIEGK
jgi:HSP20 family protein